MNIRLMLLCSSLVAAADVSAGSPPPLPLNDTGLGVCYDASAPQSCAAGTFTRQDARFGRDAAAGTGALPKTGAGAAGFDYTKIANDGSELPSDAPFGGAPDDWACTRDNVTGLVWEVKTDDGGLRDMDWLYTWYYAAPDDNGGDPGAVGFDTCDGSLGTECNSDAYVTAVNAIALCGFDNWRVPVGDELVGLVHYGIVAEPGAGTPPTIDGDYFPNTITDAAWYWTADALAQELFPIFAWFVAFNDGAANFANKDIPAAVRLVRDSSVPTRGDAVVAHPLGTVGCPSNPAIRPSTLGALSANPDGTVGDSRTGLVWDRCLLGQDAADDCAGPGDPYTWEQGLDAAEALNAQVYLGHDDWRLPNIKELRSLVERSCVSPGIDTHLFPNAPNAPAVLTSSTYPALPTVAWVVAFDSGGYVASFSKGFNHRVRLVRGGDGFTAYDALGADDVVFQDGFEPPPS